MTFSISTHWNAGRSRSCEEMINQVLALGFDTVELGYNTTLDLVPDLKAMVDHKTIKVSSLHNFCPVPVGAPYGHPELFQLTSLDSRTRQSAVTHTKRTIEFAAEIGAKAIVVHSGNVEMKHLSRDLIEMCERGQQYSPSYDKTKLKLMMLRDKKVQDHLDQLYRSLEELLPSLRQTGVRLGIENLPSWESIPSETEMEDIFQKFDKEVVSTFVGERVMVHLRSVDKVAYIRFASVYRDFKDAGELIEEVSEVIRSSESEGQAKLFDS